MSLRDILTGRQPLVQYLRGGVDNPTVQKAAFDLMPVGVQGRPQYPSVDIESLQRAYTRSEIVYAAINAKATACVDPRLLIEQRAGDGEWEEIEGHPFRRLMMRPNSYMDEAAFTQAAITSRDISGRFYAEIVRGENRLPIEMHPLNPAKIAVVPRTDQINDYEYRDGDKRVIIRGEDMIDWPMRSPLNKYDALSPLAVAMGSIDADRAQTDFIRAFFNNSGVPSGILTIKNRTLNQAQADELRGKWRLMFGRTFGNQGDVAVLDENAEYQKIGQGVGELQGDALREFTETRVAMVFGVPVLIIYAFAGLRRATYSNLKEAYGGFWDTTLTPWFKSWRSFLTWRLLPEFGESVRELIFAERIRLNYDMSQVAALQEDVDAIHKRAEAALRAGGITLNEYRALVGEDEDPQGDYYIRPFTVVTVPFAEAPAEEPAPEAAPPAGTEQRASALTPGVKKAIAKAQQAGRRTLERRIERDIKRMLSAHYEAAAAAVERAA